MADKKITALTSMGVTDPAGEDFLHIIDYGGGSSPVNKKVNLTNLFSQLNLDTTIYGTSKTFEVGFTSSSISALKVVTSSGATADGTVTINDDGVAYCDFLVKSDASDSILKVDAGANTVTINGDSANADFIVNGDTVANMIHVDGSADAVGVGKVPHTDWTLDVAATGSNAIKAAGKIEVTGDISCTANATIGGELIKFTTTRIGTSGAPTVALAGAADGSEVTIPVDSLITHIAPASTTLAYYVMAAGAQGQLKFIMNTAAHDAHIEIAGLGGASGTQVQLDANETAMFIYGTGGWWNIGGGTTVS